MARYSDIVILDYVLKEFKKGPLTHFYWFYRKLNETKSYDRTLSWLQTLSGTPRRYAASTALEAHNTAWAELLSTGLASTLSSQKTGSPEDATLAALLAVEVKRKIIKAWNERDSLGQLDKRLPCYPNQDIDVTQVDILLDPVDCEKGADCCARQEMVADPSRLKLVRQGIDNCREKPETTKRRAVVKKMISHPNEPIDHKECRNLGDAYIVFATPQQACVLTTNRHDMDALGAACNVAIHYP